MAFWNRLQKGAPSAQGVDTGQVTKSKKTVKRSPPVALEVKLLAIEALESDLSTRDVAEIVGVAETTVSAWRRQHAEGNVEALCRRSSTIAVRKKCSVLEERIVAHRRE